MTLRVTPHSADITTVHANYVEAIYELASRIMELTLHLQDHRHHSSQREKEAYLDLTMCSITSQKSHGRVSSILGVSAAALPLLGLMISERWTPLIQGVSQQIPLMGSVWTAHLQTDATIAEKRGQIHSLALQEESAHRQSDEQLPQGILAALQTLQGTCTRSSQSGA